VKFFSNSVNGTYLRDILPSSTDEVEWVKAAIAYGDDERTLVQNCLGLRKRLDIWMRYDHTVPVSPKLLRHLLRSASSNIFCRLVPDVLHSKVIWWRGYGVYIGSANLTDRAWMTNIEFGLFISEAELAASEALTDIELFFDTLDSYDEVFDLTEDIIKEQEAIQAARNIRDSETNAAARRMRSVAPWGGPSFIPGKRAAVDRQKEAFIKEWRNGAAILGELANSAPAYRPVWLHEDVPAPWQADQFLHAYYYNQVVEGPAHPYEEFYRANFKSPKLATDTALKWWSELGEPPSEEDVNCHERAPSIRRLLAPGEHRALSQADLYELLQANHSSRDHIRRMTFEQLHVSPDEQHGVDRVLAFSRWLWSQRNAKGQTVGELIEFVLDGGRAEEMPSRLFDACQELAFPHLGKNQLAEIAGWARPEKYSPRNGRTSKALRALGYNVRVY